MSMRLKELQDLERFLALKESMDEEVWEACLAEMEKCSRAADRGAVEELRELLALAMGMGSRHLEAVRELKLEERKKGVIDYACGW